jgi:thiamine pyrophosphate-dependent acetolactate synthase large subunit-like protein
MSEKDPMPEEWRESIAAAIGCDVTDIKTVKEIDREIAEALEVVAARLTNILTDPAFVHARHAERMIDDARAELRLRARELRGETKNTGH